MIDLNEIKLFIGIKIVRYENRITLDQSAYIKTILDKFKMADCKTMIRSSGIVWIVGGTLMLGVCRLGSSHRVESERERERRTEIPAV